MAGNGNGEDNEDEDDKGGWFCEKCGAAYGNCVHTGNFRR